MSKAEQPGAALARHAMRGVCWSFIGSPFPTRAAFEAEARQYQIDITGEDSWRPDEVVIPAPRVAVQYMCWEGEEQVEPVVEFVADDGRAFTAGEVLFKLHNALVERLRDINHHFFEGLMLSASVATGGVPLYHLVQGS